MTILEALKNVDADIYAPVTVHYKDRVLAYDKHEGCFLIRKKISELCFEIFNRTHNEEEAVKALLEGATR